MKNLLLLLLTSLSLSANNLFLYSYNDKLEITEVVNNKLVALDTVAGKTYGLANNPSIVTDTNSYVTFVFPHRIAVYQKENSSVYLNETPVDYLNNFKLPEIVKVNSSMFNFSAQGEIYCISETTNQNTIGTTMGNVVFNKARLFIKAGEKFTQVYVINGNAIVLDSRSSKKKKELKEGDCLIITPQIAINPKDTKVTGLGNSFSIKDVEDIEKQLHDDEIKSLQSQLDNVIFVNQDTNIFGVRLK